MVTSGAAGAETRLGREAVLLRYAALLSVLKSAGWRMGERVIALHPAEYGYLENLPSMLAGLHFGRASVNNSVTRPRLVTRERRMS